MTIFNGSNNKIDEKLKLYNQGTLYDTVNLVRESVKNLKSAAAHLNKKEGIGAPLGKINEWLYDNFYLIKQCANKALIDLKGIKNLRYVKIEDKKYPFILLAANEFLSINNNKTNASLIKEYIKNNQDRLDLKNCELSFFTLMLKLCLIIKISDIYKEASPNEKPHLIKSMENAVQSIRFLNTFDFLDLFLELSRVNNILLKDPAGIYAKSDTKTKLYYLSLLQHLARFNKVSEVKTAEKIITQCENSAGEDIKKAHVGYWLLKSEASNKKRKNIKVLYFTLTSFIWLCCMVFLAMVSNNILFLSISGVILIDILKNIANQAVIKNVAPDVLPKMEYKEGVPKEERTLCVISSLLIDYESSGKYIDLIEEFYLSNKEKNLYFGILGDFKDGESPDDKKNKKIEDDLGKNIERLNTKYQDKPFCLFIRGQTYNHMQKNYMGYERKRGALKELSSLIVNGETGSFCKIICNCDISSFQNVITLDSDTRLLPGTAMEMIKTIAHPLNKPRYNADKTRVEEGYAILQPRISTGLFASNKTMFTKIFCGGGGVDTYSNHISDIYQDLFKEGIFCGKGIFNTRVYFDILKHLPDNKILSHDLLEGSYLRSAFLSDIELVDSFPKTVLSYFQRQNRWIRGDFQLIPWLFSKVRNNNGQKEKNPLGPLSKYKISDNLFRAVLPLFLLAAILYGGFLNNLWGFVLIFIALFDIFFPFILGVIDKLTARVESFRVKSNIIYGTRQKFLYCFLNFCFLPFAALDNICAIIVTLYRMAVNKNLLVWVTAQQDEKRNNNEFFSYVKKMWINIVLPAALLLFIFNNSFYDYFLLTIAALFLLTPFFAYRISAKKSVAEPLNERQIQNLKGYLKLIWNYFDDFVNQENNFLPPDNYQEDPYNGLACRTSPTNIGLGLLCLLSAYDFSYIDKETLFKRLEKTLSTVEKLEKWHGHLYNWYDTKTLEVLRPRYVSTVDSGNFLGYIITLIEGLKDIDAENRYEKRLQKLIDNADFAKLYCQKKNLFYIGYNHQDDSFDNSFYDLMASESRQTSYIGIALLKIPKIHWEKLSRNLSKSHGYRGYFSWTGTMFEYFMPNLIMPVYKNSMIYESLKYALFCQIKAVGKKKIWGISESAYYAFDNAFNYQYKAFGVQRLALKRGMDKDYVVSAYSTFLAMLLDPKKAYDNLLKYLEISPAGKYGFYEAIDFSNSNTDQGYFIVKSYMSHHLGMSMLALNNCVNDNIMQRRFMKNKSMHAFRSLLEEKINLDWRSNADFAANDKKPKPRAIKKSQVTKKIKNPNSLYPKMNALGSKRYALIHTDSGSGFSLFNDINITRRNFLLDNPQGIYFFAGTDKNNAISLTFAPNFDKNIKYEAKFNQYSSIFSANSSDFHTKLEVVGGAGMPLEGRKISIRNNGRDSRLTLALYFEPTLTTHSGDIDHRTFSNLFIETAYLEKENILIVKRRSREESKKEVYLALSFCGGKKIGFETKRQEILGRRSSIKDIKHLMFKDCKNTTKSVLDPCVFIKSQLECGIGRNAHAYVTMACGHNLDELIELVKNYNSHEGFDKLKEMAKTRAFAENQVSYIDDTQRLMAFDILSSLYIVMPVRKPLEQYIKKNELAQDSLWKYGISGDNPIMLIVINDTHESELLSDYLKVFIIFMLRGIKVDMIVAYNESGQYDKPLFNAISDEIEKNNLSGHLHGFGGIHPINLKAINESDINLIFSSANYYSNSQDEKKEKIDLNENYYCESNNNDNTDNTAGVHTAAQTDTKLDFYNGYGGFYENGYVIENNNKITPQPYSHIIANNQAGAVVTAGGGGFSFVKNARQNKITRWSADPLNEPVIEQLKLVFDNQEFSFYADKNCGGALKSATYAPGYARFNMAANSINASETIFAPNSFPCIIRSIRLENKSKNSVNFKVLFYCRLALGVHEEITKKFIVTNYRRKDNILTAKNRYNSEFSNMNTFLHCSESFGFTCDYRDVLKKDYTLKKTGICDDPCFCICADVELTAGQSKELVILLGQYSGENQLLNMLKYLGSPQKAKEQLYKVTEKYDEFLGKIKISTPGKALDKMINTFSLYQTYVCRILAKTSFYQCGGAFGFRDQLQDCLSVLFTDPKIARAHILRSAAHQFLEGDVQHWWHCIKTDKKMGHRGIKTRYSDDLLWLCYVVIEYIKVSGDYDILDKEVYYIEQEPLKDGEHEKYTIPRISDVKESIFQHCIRAINYSMNFGKNGLCKMRGGDWNDGMNLVGIENEGESVWLSWFFANILDEFSKLCQYKNQNETADLFKNRARGLFENIEKSAWDGDWYLRAFFDDGTALGSKDSLECKIDSIAQSFSVISNPGDITKRKLSALDSAVDYLYDKENRIIKLFTPPFDKIPKNPGYIKGYVKGVRENGGQYTHASIWLCMSLFLSGKNDVAFELFDAINPVNHALNIEGANKYKVEPYVLAADVYSNDEFAGMGGWSWYTGAASWFYIVAVQSLLGLYIRGEKIILKPRLPSGWDGANIEYRHKTSVYNIKINNLYKGNTLKSLKIDGVLQNSNTILLLNDKKSYTIEIEI